VYVRESCVTLVCTRLPTRRCTVSCALDTAARAKQQVGSSCSEGCRVAVSACHAAGCARQDPARRFARLLESACTCRRHQTLLRPRPATATPGKRHLSACLALSSRKVSSVHQPSSVAPSNAQPLRMRRASERMQVQASTNPVHNVADGVDDDWKRTQRKVCISCCMQHTHLHFLTGLSLL